MALTADFAEAKQIQWVTFLKRTDIALTPKPFPEILERIAEFLMPPALALTKASPFIARWAAGGPWTDKPN